MLDEIVESKPKIHTRDISFATYLHDDDSFIVHGTLKDLRHVDVFDPIRGVKNPGVIHHMDVKLLIKPDPFRIVDAAAKMITIPDPLCAETLDTIEKLIGIEIKAGFSSRILSIMGGNRGCTHLCQLIVAMGPEIIQGGMTWRRSGNNLASTDSMEKAAKGAGSYFVDTCRLWRKDGPRVKSVEKAIEQINTQ